MARRTANTPARELLAAASVGRFVRFEPDGANACGEFESRAYRVRRARQADTPRLEALERVCWPADLRASGDTIALRIQRYRDGQLVLEHDAEVVGAIYSQRIRQTEALRQTTSQDVERLHDPEAAVAQILTLNLDPRFQDRRWGEQLLEFFLCVASATPAVARVAGVTRCASFGGGRRQELEEYVGRLGADGRPLDPILRLHHSRGAQIRGIIPGYRSRDLANLGCGVLVEYDLDSRRVAPRLAVARPDARDHRFRGSLRAADVEAMLRETVARLLDADPNDEMLARTPLLELGLGSAQLLMISQTVASRCGVALDPLFFFEHNTCARAAEWIAAQPEIAPRREATV